VSPLFGKRSSGPSARERGLMRRHLRGLEEKREESLRDLGGLAMEMYRRDRFDSRLLWTKAAEATAVDDEIRLIQRGLEEDRTVAELQELAREAAEAEQETGHERSLRGDPATAAAPDTAEE
jgi:hypothetical protein